MTFLLPILATGPAIAGQATAALCESPPEPPTDCDRPDVFCVGSGSDGYDTIDDLGALPPGATVVVTGAGGTLTITEGGAAGDPVTYYGGESSSEWTIAVLADHVVVQGFALASPTLANPCVNVGTVLRYTDDVEVAGNACSGRAGVLLTSTVGARVRSNAITVDGGAGTAGIGTLGDIDTVVSCNQVAGGTSAIWLTYAERARVERNQVSGTAYAGVQLDGCLAPVVAGNLITDVGAHGIIADTLLGYQTTALVVMGNTVRAQDGAALRIDGNAGGHTWFDNILASNDAAGAVNLDDAAHVRSGSNVIVGSLVLDQQAGSVADWQSTGLETGSIEAALIELFVAEDDLQLAPGSPAIGLGVDRLDGAEMIDVDLQGNARPCVALDAGAFESCESPDDPGDPTGVPDVEDDEPVAFGLAGGYCGHVPVPGASLAALVALVAVSARRTAPTAARPRSTAPRGPRTPAPSR
jgi:hypothetical protein